MDMATTSGQYRLMNPQRFAADYNHNDTYTCKLPIDTIIYLMHVPKNLLLSHFSAIEAADCVHASAHMTDMCANHTAFMGTMNTHRASFEYTFGLDSSTGFQELTYPHATTNAWPGSTMDEIQLLFPGILFPQLRVMDPFGFRDLCGFKDPWRLWDPHGFMDPFGFREPWGFRDLHGFRDPCGFRIRDPFVLRLGTPLVLGSVTPFVPECKLLTDSLCVKARTKSDAVSLDFNKKFYNSLGIRPRWRRSIPEAVASMKLLGFLLRRLLSDAILRILTPSLVAKDGDAVSRHCSSALALQVLRRLGSIFISVYAAVQKLKKDSWLELQFSLVDNSKLNAVYLLNKS
ncbi:hypothetical protein Tco_1135652 [Tanacetum coccineum]